MSSNIVSRNTDSMRGWANTMSANADEYSSLINRLYSLIEQFVGTEDFKGGLSTDFLTKMSELRPEFEKYSTTFEECSKLIKDRSIRMDNSDAELASRISRGNPFYDR